MTAERTSRVAWGLAIKNFVGPAETPDIDAIYRYAERAEALGFESLWAWDHVILGVDPAFPILDAVGTLTAIAARTHRIKLGTGILVLPLRNPTIAAKALGTLDVVSGGRLILGVAAGWYAREFDAVGVPFTQRGRLFERNLEILTRLWTEDRVTARVDELNLREAVMRPRPVQQPRPPILIGGYVDAVLRRVATVGDGWLTYFYTPESYRRSWEKIVAFAREAGRDPAALTGTNQLAIHVGRSRAETEAPLRRWLETEWDVAAWSESTIEHAIRGSVDECVEQLRGHVAAGVHRVILIPYRYEPEQVEVIAREILPRVG
jgi:alkanesulfonate monooxygenase